jgi:diguanylate cyclase (GGDEF)-like protein
MFLDLDRFKLINDTFGHAVGDRLLREFADRLTGCVRREDAVAALAPDADPPALARLGGDEFTVLLTDLTGLGDAAKVAERILAAMAAPFELGEHRVSVATSIGIALFPDDGADADALLKRADTAMYRAKAEGRGCFRFFEPEMDEEVRRRVELEAELRQAVLRDELVPHFQPLVALGPDGAGARLVGFEMLARWPHASRGTVPPAEFIPLAEDTGLIAPMTERLLRRACSAAAAWPSELTLAVNVSPVQLRDRALPGVVRHALAESGLPASRLELELTESALVENLDLAREVVGELKAAGVRLALDDFGTGYSSLRHLQALPFDKIKVDAGFVRSMVGNPESGKIVAAVIGLGHSLGLPTVAEGVEDASTAETLAAMGCDIGQGWLFGRPMPEAEATALAIATAAPEAAEPSAA